MTPAVAHTTRVRWTLSALLLLTACVIAVTATPAGAAKSIAPVLECVALNTDGSFTAVFGTENATGGDVVIPVGKDTNGKWDNYFKPTEDMGQATLILAGRRYAVASVISPDGDKVEWRLGDDKASAERDDTPCSDKPAVPDVPAAVFAGVAALLGGALGLRRLRPPAADTPA